MRGDAFDCGCQRLRLRHGPLLHHRIDLLDHRIAGQFHRTGRRAGGYRVVILRVLLDGALFIRQKVGGHTLSDQR